jgi:hypothetical protein
MIVGMSLQTYFSIQHVQAAAYFSRKVSRLERHFGAGPMPPTVAVIGKGYVSTALFTSVAFLEALANELFADAEMPDGGHLSILGRQPLSLIADVGNVESVEKAAVMSKFDLLLRLANREPIERDRNPSQDLATMIRLRNELVHYKAEFFDVGTEGMVRPGNFTESKLARQIVGKFAHRANSSGAEADSWLGAGCAQWAVRSAIAYTDEVFRRLGIVPLYDHVRGNLSEA